MEKIQKEFDSLEAEVNDLDNFDSNTISDDTEIPEENSDEGTEEIQPDEDEIEDDVASADRVDDSTQEVTEPEAEIIEEDTEDVDSPAALRAEINRLTELLSTQAPAVIQSQSEEATAPGMSDEVFDYVGELHMDDISADPDLFNQVMHKLEKRIIENTAKTTMLNIPNLVIHHIKQQKAVNTSVEQFYAENTDLAEVKSTVGHVANIVASEHPDWDINQVFKETAVKTRKLLKLPALSSSGKSNALMTDPNKVKSKVPNRQVKPTGRQSKLQQELDEL